MSIKINQLETTLENRQVYGYKRDGNTVTAHRWKVFHLSGNLYLQEPQADQYGQRYTHVVLFSHDVKIGLDIGMLSAWQLDQYSVEDVVNRIGFSDVDTFSAMIRAQMEHNGYIKNSYIAFVSEYDMTLARKMEAYKAEWLDCREKQQEAERAERERKEEQKRKEQEKALSEAIEQAEKKILSGGRIENTEINGKCLFLHLFDKHGVNVAIRSRGWIIDKLKAVIKSADGSTQVSFKPTRNGEKISNGFCNAFYELCDILLREKEEADNADFEPVEAVQDVETTQAVQVDAAINPSVLRPSARHYRQLSAKHSEAIRVYHTEPDSTTHVSIMNNAFCLNSS